MSASGETDSYTVTGTVSYGDVDSLGFGTIAAWDVETAQAVLGREGAYDQISIAAKDGTSPAELVKAVRPLLPDTLEVKDSAVQADEASAEIDEGMAYVRYFLLGFGAIALFVGAFVIFNTLSITVAQRTREFATLRTLGASRKQVLRSVRLEGLVIGLVASTIGLFLGFGIAKGMLALFSAMGVDLPDAPARVRAAHRDRLAAPGHRDHAARDDHPGAPGDARAADRRGPRGLDAAGVALRGALAEGGARRDALVARRDLGRRVRERDQRSGRRAAARARRDRAVPRHRAARTADGEAAGEARRLARAPRGRRRR